MVNKKHKDLSVRRQCRLLEVPRSMLYYRGKGEKEENKKLIRLIFEKFEEDPTFGIWRMTAFLRRLGYQVNL